MQKNEKPSVELKVYELLGVKQFRKLVFLLEKLIHFRDKGVNQNYHISNYSLDEIKKFKKFLFYNGRIHIQNSFWIVIGIILELIFIGNNVILTSVLCEELIRNLYCIMLQRYNYIRMNDLENKIIDKKTNKITEIVKKENENNYKKEKSSNIEIVKCSVCDEKSDMFANLSIGELKSLKQYLIQKSQDDNVCNYFLTKEKKIN